MPVMFLCCLFSLIVFAKCSLLSAVKVIRRKKGNDKVPFHFKEKCFKISPFNLHTQRLNISGFTGMLTWVGIIASC